MTPFDVPVEFMLHTGARRAEVFELPWSEIHNLDTDPMWIMPGVRTKNGREHILPLSKAAADLLMSVPRQKDASLVWPSSVSHERPMSGFSKSLKSMQKRVVALAEHDGITVEHWTLHDLRRSVASGMNGLHDDQWRSLISEVVVERILNHTPQGVKGVYNRWKYQAEKKAALDLWANHLAALRKLGAQKFSGGGE
jgi:integrase